MKLIFEIIMKIKLLNYYYLKLFFRILCINKYIFTCTSLHVNNTENFVLKAPAILVAIYNTYRGVELKSVWGTWKKRFPLAGRPHCIAFRRLGLDGGVFSKRLLQRA